jgi:predicted RNA-binding Zn-ribbon protein involved in translation (DUF1610 family)
MASIALSIIGCIDYLAYGTIFMRAMFRPKKKLDVFFPARKAGDEPRRVVETQTSVSGLKLNLYCSGGALFGRNLNNIRLNHCTYCGIAMSVQQSTLLWNCYECGRVWTSVCLGTLRNASWGFLIA